MLMIYLNQSHFIRKMLKNFGMEECKFVATPMEGGVQLMKEMEPRSAAEMEEMKAIPYIGVVGSCMWTMGGRRCDIAYAVGVLGRYMHNPGK